MFKLNRLALFALAFFVSSPAFSQQGNARGPIGESPYNIVSLWACLLYTSDAADE